MTSLIARAIPGVSSRQKTLVACFSTVTPRLHRRSYIFSISDRRATPTAAANTRTVLFASRGQQQARTAVTSSNPLGDTEQSTSSVTSGNSNLSEGFSDQPFILDEGSRQVDWSRSYHGLSAEAFPKESIDALLAPIPADDVEVKSDGIIYLPEIKYRRILNKAFGPGAWGLAPRGETIVTEKAVTREYALVILGRLVSVARGEQDYFSPDGIPTATEGCKSNALMRCCKDLGVASELWDPRFIRKFMAQHAREVFVEHVVTKKRKKIYIRKDDKVPYPFKETKFGS